MSETDKLFPDSAGIQPKRREGRNSKKGEWKESSEAERQEFFLPVTNFVWFYPEEMQIINHPAFQRLASINQLGQAHLVYRGATHKRIEHVLGVVGVAQRMIAALKQTSEKGKLLGDLTYAPGLSIHEERFIRLAALLHDIGHLAAGHTLEDELEIIGKHDADRRLTFIFDKTEWDGIQCKPLSNLINHEYKNYVPQSLANDMVSASDIVRILVRKHPKSSEDDFARQYESVLNSSDIRFEICSNIVGNTICADILDYLYRDWYHIGKIRSFDDRIFQYMELRRQSDGRIAEAKNRAEINQRSCSDRFVIALGSGEKIRTDGVSAILGLLEWRYELAEAVLFHRTKVAAGAMLDRALFELWEDKSEDELINMIISLSDDQLVDVALKEVQSKNAASAPMSIRCAAKVLNKLKHRKIYKVLETYDAVKLPEKRLMKAKELYCSSYSARGIGARNRASCARELEIDFKVPTGSIAIYCAEAKAKIAKVSVAIDDRIMEFDKYEEFTKNRLSGAHLDAQISRFEGLWRIHFFIDEDILDTMEADKVESLKGAISSIVLGVESGNAMYTAVRRFARDRFVEETRSGSNRVRLKDDVPMFAKGDPSVADIPRYPNGAPCIRNFLVYEE